MQTTKLLFRCVLMLALLCGAGSLYKAQAQEEEKPQRVVQTDEVFEAPEVVAVFGNGQQDLIQYLAKNVKYPKSAEKKGEQGKVFVQFIVERDGSLSNIRIKKSATKDLDKEALRLVRTMPKWKPGLDDKGKTVRTEIVLPIAFRLK